MIFSNNRLGKFIRNGRQDLKLTQEQLAEELNCNLSYLGNIERGKNIPSLKLFCRIIQLLSLSADEFIHQNRHAENTTYLQVIRLLPQCTPKELNILLENARTLLANREERPTDPL
jgi:transcriptional regulator with XRE-family HTH domain